MSSSPPPGPEWSGTGWNQRPPWADGDSFPPGPFGDPLVPANFRGWVDRVVGVVRRSWFPLLIIQVGAAAVSALLTWLLNALTDGNARPSGPDGLLIMLILLVDVAVGAVVQGASVYVAIKDAAGRESTASEGMRFAINRAPLLIGWALVALALVVIGFLLIVPGIYLAIVFGATLAGVVAVERAGVPRCLELVHRRFRLTASRVVPAAAVGAGYAFLVAPFLVDALSQPRSVSEALLQAALGVPLSVVAVGVSVVTYAELRHSENTEVATSTLAAELDR